MGSRRSQWVYVCRLLAEIMPAVHAELRRWRAQALLIERDDLREQALNSLQYKRFHCEGGAVFAGLVGRSLPDTGPNPRAARRPLWRRLVRAIVALQTISDYADNLVDRWRPEGGELSEELSRAIHRSLLDAVSPGASGAVDGSGVKGRGRRPRGAGGVYFPGRRTGDGGYLEELVLEARRAIRGLPSYSAVYGPVRWLAARYAEMQVLKHLEPSRREKLLKDWFRSKGSPWAEELDWWEFAAACGSTLGIFVLLAAAARKDTEPADAQLLFQAYFPWVCGLHIMLDYFIDQEEDRIGGDLNFAACYGGSSRCTRRLGSMVRRSLAAVGDLPDRWEPAFHTLVVRGLPGLYFSDGKVGRQNLHGYARSVLKEAGPGAHTIRLIAKAVRWTRREGLLVQPPPAAGVVRR